MNSSNSFEYCSGNSSINRDTPLLLSYGLYSSFPTKQMWFPVLLRMSKNPLKSNQSVQLMATHNKRFLEWKSWDWQSAIVKTK